MKRNNFLKSLLGLPFVLPLLSFDKKKKIKWGTDMYKGFKLQKREEVTFFTPEMLRRYNVGLFIINSKVKEVTEKNIGYAATVSWKLCWQISSFKELHNKAMPKYGIVNFLTDGWFCPIGNTDEEVCNFLNNNKYGEKYRLMTKEEVLFIISNRKQGFL